MLDLTNLPNYFYAKILLLLLRNSELTWGKSIKLVSGCNEEWLEFNSFFETLISNFLWWISSCNNFNWHCLYVKEALKDWLLTRKLKKIDKTLLSLHRNRNSKCNLACCRQWSSFSNFSILLSVLWPFHNQSVLLDYSFPFLILVRYIRLVYCCHSAHEVG